MKKLFKYLLIGLAVIIVLGVIAGLGEETTPTVEDKAVETAQAEKQPKEEATDEDTLPGRAEYEAIKNGMTREQVEALFGKVDVQLESESEFENIKTLMVVYGAEGKFGASITVTFIDGVVESKSNFELE